MIDWGLAEFYHPNTDYHIRVGSRYYKAPELLLKKPDYNLDTWALGCIVAEIINDGRPLFGKGLLHEDQLISILHILGWRTQ